MSIQDYQTDQGSDLVWSYEIGQLVNELNWELQLAVCSTNSDKNPVFRLLEKIEVKFVECYPEKRGGPFRAKVAGMRKDWDDFIEYLSEQIAEGSMDNPYYLEFPADAATVIRGLLPGYVDEIEKDVLKILKQKGKSRLAFQLGKCLDEGIHTTKISDLSFALMEWRAVSLSLADSA